MSKYDPLGTFLRSQEAPLVQLSFPQIERILGAPLPPSARKHHAWWANPRDNSHPHSRAWLDNGYRTGPVDFVSGTVKFIRNGAPTSRSAASPSRVATPAFAPDHQPLSGTTGGRRIGLVGCVKEKRPTGTWPAQDLYTSTLFQGRRRYVTTTCDSWWILSAACGLVHPTTPLQAYDVTLKSVSTRERREWSARVVHSLFQQTPLSAGDVVEIHAGAEYREHGLTEGLERVGVVVEIPTQGLGIGKQLQFYARGPQR